MESATEAILGNPVDSKSLLTLLASAVVSAIICELIGWLFVYRKPDYERRNDNFKKASKRLEKKKEESLSLPSISGKGGKGKDKKLIQLEREFEVANRDLMQTKSRTGMLTAFVHMATFFYLKSSYDGIVLARLPFEPFALVYGMSHRNIPGTDPRDCGMIFIYALCSMCIKPNLQRALGHAPPKTAIPKGIELLAERWIGVEPEKPVPKSAAKKK